MVERHATQSESGRQIVFLSINYALAVLEKPSALSSNTCVWLLLHLAQLLNQLFDHLVGRVRFGQRAEVWMECDTIAVNHGVQTLHCVVFDSRRGVKPDGTSVVYAAVSDQQGRLKLLCQIHSANLLVGR